jgi:hypothetical protein
MLKTFSGIQNLFQNIQPTRAYIHNIQYTSIYNQIQCINRLKRTQLLERLTPSSPYNCQCSLYNLALHSNKIKSRDSIRIYLFPVYILTIPYLSSSQIWKFLSICLCIYYNLLIHLLLSSHFKAYQRSLHHIKVIRVDTLFVRVLE